TRGTASGSGRKPGRGGSPCFGLPASRGPSTGKASGSTATGVWYRERTPRSQPAGIRLAVTARVKNRAHRETSLATVLGRCRRAADVRRGMTPLPLLTSDPPREAAQGERDKASL